jgi:hypothetical protein
MDFSKLKVRRRRCRNRENYSFISLASKREGWLNPDPETIEKV